MDTPNTRSRRKRELNELGEEDEGGQVEWREDQHIRRLLARATADGEWSHYIRKHSA